MKKKNIVLHRSMRQLAAFFAASLFAVSGASADTFTIPSGVVVIEDSAFEGVSAFTVLEIPESVEQIGDHAFAGCDGITDIYVQSDTVSLGENALGSNKEIVVHCSDGSTADEYAQQHKMKSLPLNAAQLVLDYAATQLETSYSQHDCVIFVYECYYKTLGIRIHDTCVSIEQKTDGVRIDNIADLQPGDIMCWKNDDVSYCTHVGMYVGNGVFIESSRGAKKVRYNTIEPTGSSYYTRNFMGAWRIL